MFVNVQRCLQRCFSRCLFCDICFPFLQVGNEETEYAAVSRLDKGLQKISNIHMAQNLK